MGEIKNKKITLSNILLLVAVFIIIIMAMCIFKLKNEIVLNANNDVKQDLVQENNVVNEDEETNKINNTINNEVNENDNEEIKYILEKKTSDNDFKELMEILYPEKEYRGDNTTYEYILSEECSSQVVNTDDKLLEIETTSLYLYEDKIAMYIETSEDLKINGIYTSITGIDEEIVDVELEVGEASATPTLVTILTRNGNVYYVDDFSTKEFEAKKIEELSEIIKIVKIGVSEDEAYHSYTTTIAIDKDGNQINLAQFIYKYE